VIIRAAFASSVVLLSAGCTTTRPPAATLDPASAAADYAARSLRDEHLRQFLTENVDAAAGTNGWDFETLSWVAFFYHPSLAVARAQWATARAAQATAALRPNPTLTLTPGYNTTREPGLSPWFPGISADFLFPASGKRARQQDVARADAEAARLSVLSAAWQVRAELRRVLSDAAIASRRVDVLRAQAAAQRALVALIEQRFNAGGATATELATARVGMLRAEAAGTEATSQALTMRVRVATALGLPTSALDGVTLPVPPLAPSMSRDALLAARQESLRARADILAALAKYHGAQATLELEVAKQFPDFHLGPGYQWDQGANKWSLGLTFELPLYHRNEAPIAEAVAKRAEAAAHFTVVQAQALAAIEAATAAQTAAALQLDHARQLRDEIEKQTGRASQRVALGAADQLELQLARVEVASAETLILDAEAAASVAAGQLEDALQLPFPHVAELADAARVHVTSSP
jgi:outer membrane protein TolC